MIITDINGTRNQEKTVNPAVSGFDVTPDSGYTGLKKVTVNAIPNQKSDSGNVTLNGSTTSKSYAAGYYANAHGAQHSTVNIPDPTFSRSGNNVTASGSWTAGFTTDTSYTNTYAIPTETKTITANGTYTPSSGKLFSSVTANIPVGTNFAMTTLNLSERYTLYENLTFSTTFKANHFAAFAANRDAGSNTGNQDMSPWAYRGCCAYSYINSTRRVMAVYGYNSYVYSWYQASLSTSYFSHTINSSSIVLTCSRGDVNGAYFWGPTENYNWPITWICLYWQ